MLVSLSQPGTAQVVLGSSIPPWGEIWQTLTLRSGYNTNLVILGAAFLGLSAGVVGVFALLRKRSMTTDAVGHATLPGIVVAFLLAGLLGLDGRSLPLLLTGATLSAVLGVVSIQAILRHGRLREDAAIGIVLSVFFGAGVVGLSYIQKNAPVGSAGLNAMIYGQAAAMQVGDVMLMAGIAGAAVLIAFVFSKELQLVCFNDAFAKVGGWPVRVLDALILGLVVLVTVAGLQAVGLILIVAMLIIPPVAARFWTERFRTLLILAGCIGAASGYAGAVLSALLPRKPAGAVIVLAAGGVFVISMFAAPARGVVASTIRWARLRLQIAGDHLLEHAHELGEPLLGRGAMQELARERGWSASFMWFLPRLMRWTGAVERMEPDGVRVSVSGLARGATVSRNHALWEQYLVSYADVAPNHVDWSVDQVEHVLSPELIRELEAKIGLASKSNGAVV